MNVPLPANLPLLIDNPDIKDDVATILKGETSLPDCLYLIGRNVPLKIWFSEPVTLATGKKGWSAPDGQGWKHHQSGDKASDVHVIRGFFRTTSGDLCYTPSYCKRNGYYFEAFDKIVKWEPIKWEPIIKTFEFSSYEQFRKRFDLKFITEAEIKRLWDGTSAQHGGKYRPTDFKSLSSTGSALMRRFLTNFKGVGSPDKVSEKHRSYNGRGAFGRDITISYEGQTRQFVYYSSEFPNCGNGTYGLIANASTYLWLEND